MVLLGLALAAGGARGGPIHDAAHRGDLAKVRALLAEKPERLDEPNAQHWTRGTPLFFALRHPQLAALLLEKGANPNARNARAETPLMCTAKYGTTEMAALLLRHGANIEAADRHGFRPLHTAALRREPAMLGALIAKAANVDGATPVGLRPLHFAASKDPDRCKTLIAAGAQVDVRDAIGQTPLFSANSPKVAAFLLEAGASLDAADTRGWTPLHEAASRGATQLLAFLVQRGMKPDVADADGWTPLHAAARAGHAGSVAKLIELGANAHTADQRGWPPARDAALRGHEAIVSLLEAAPKHEGKPVPAKPWPGPTGKPEHAVTPGRLAADRPTFHCLGVYWSVQGDADRDAAVDVAFRRKGDAAWRPAHPLLRMQNDRIASSNPTWAWTTPDMFAGSLFGLDPGTEYEVRLTLRDPDGVAGGDAAVTRTLSLATRAYPKAFRAGRRLHVYAATHKGPTQKPAFADIQAAYDAAQPGDTILVHAGNHQKDLVMGKKATAERPIAVRGAGDGEAMLQGVGNDIINVQGSSHHIFEDLTLYDADSAFLARGETHALTVRRCRITRCKRGVFGISNRNTDFLVTDCDLTGPVQQWHPRKPGKSQGVYLAGQGHVVAFCRIRRYWDGLSITRLPHGVPPERLNCAIEFHNNEISECVDDAIEMDMGVRNIRVYRNLIRNALMGISTQPLFGGPGYIFRNVVYNTTRKPLKLHVEPAGLLILHNTLVGSGIAAGLSIGWTNSVFHNNLFIGEGGEWVLAAGTPRPDLSRMDYNAYTFWKPAIHWVAPRRAAMGEASFRSLAEFSTAMGYGYARHSFVVTPAIFRSYTAPRGGDQPEGPLDADLRLKPGASAIDAGLPIPAFNDHPTGAAPDLGAYELAAPVPHYGPRPRREGAAGSQTQ